MLMIDKGEEGRELIFDCGFPWDMARLMQCHCHAIIGGIRKMVARQIVVRNNFQEGVGHYTDQNTLFRR